LGEASIIAKPEKSGNIDLRVELGGGSKRNLEESAEFSVRAAGGPFRDV